MAILNYAPDPVVEPEGATSRPPLVKTLDELDLIPVETKYLHPSNSSIIQMMEIPMLLELFIFSILNSYSATKKKQNLCLVTKNQA